MEDVKVVEEFLRSRSVGPGFDSGLGLAHANHVIFGPTGSGFGSGSGSGAGNVSGSGSGDGNLCDCIKAFNGERVWAVNDTPTLIDLILGDYAQGRILCCDLTTESCYVARVDNCFAHGRTLKEAVADAESKATNMRPIEERISRFKESFPSLETQAKGYEFYRWHYTLTGSCTMGRDQFIREHELDMEKEYTVQYFLDITKEAYGGSVIHQLLISYQQTDQTS